MFDTGTLDGLKGAVNRWLLPQLYFLQFSVAQVLVGLRKKLINNFVFPTWACAAGFNNNNSNNINNTATKLYLDTTTYLNKTETSQPGKTIHVNIHYTIVYDYTYTDWLIYSGLNNYSIFILNVNKRIFLFYKYSFSNIIGYS